MISLFQQKVIGGAVSLAVTAFCFKANAQTPLPLTDLTSFRSPGPTWKLAGEVSADLAQDNVLNLLSGTGILVNLPDKNNHGADLFTNFQHGDLDLELDYIMAKGSNSVIYLSSRYEEQLLDSWGVKNHGTAITGAFMNAGTIVVAKEQKAMKA